MAQVDERISKALDVAIARGEVGVQVAAYLGDKLIVDACIGVADEQTGRSAEDALFPIFSVTKAVMATGMQMLEERGLMDLDAPIADYWPEYAAHGKGKITSRDVLTHRAGVPHMPPHMTLDMLKDWDGIVRWMAEEVTPVNAPGEKSVYHAGSFGYLLGEVMRRVDPQHRMPNVFLREEILVPIGADDFWIGIPPELEPRVARLTYGAAAPFLQIPRTPLRALMSPEGMGNIVEKQNTPQAHQFGSPSGGGITTAKAGARFFSLLANGGALGGKRYVAEKRLRDALQYRDNPLEYDEGISRQTTNGVAGFWVGGDHPATDPVLGTSRVLAHGGAGGSMGWADLDSKLAVMITHNRFFGDPPAEEHPFVPLANAVREIAAEMAVTV